MLYSYLFLFFSLILITNCQIISNEKSKLASYVLNDFYQRQNSLLDFKNVQILNIYKQEDLLFGQVIVEASAESIGTARIYCEVVAFDNGNHLSQPPGEDPSQCVMQEFPSPVPSTEPGPDDLRAVDVSDPSVDDVLAKALEHSPELNQLRLVRVKAARIQGSSGTWFIRADMLRMLEEGSTMQYCAIELTPQEEGVLSSLRISSINCQLGNGGLISTRSFNQVARRAVEHINSISPSRFKQNLIKILDAVESRNGGPLNDQYTLKLLMTPSVCQKRDKNDDEINRVWEEHRSCIDDPASEKEQRYICELTVWFGSSHAENPLFSPSKCKHTPFDKKQTKTTDHGRTYSGTTTETISTTSTETPQDLETELSLEETNNKGYPKSSEEFLDPIITSQSLSDPKIDDSLKENLKISSEEENFKKEENFDESKVKESFEDDTTTTTEEPLKSDDSLKENLKTKSSEEENFKKEEILSESKDEESSDDKDYYTITTEETLKSEHVPSVEGHVEIFEEIITPKQIYCTGCLHEINVERADLKNLTILALEHMNQNQKNKYSLVQIKSAQMQVTNGINYFLTYELSMMPSCSSLVESCQNVEQPSHIICSVELYEKPWIETSLVVLHSNCTKDSDNNLENEIVPSLPNEEIELKRLSTFENLFKPDVSKETHVKDPMSEFYSFPDDGLEDDLLPQPSHPIIDLTQISRRKREIQVLKDMTDSERELIEELAQISVRTMDELDPDDNRRVVLDVLEAKKQIVNGMLYHLKLRVGLTSCSESKEIEDKAKCLEEDNFSKICSVQLHRAFIDDEPNKVRVVELICSDENSKEHKSKNIKNRKKRETHFERSKRLKRGSKSTSPILVGGYQPTDINDPMITSSASFALSELDKQSNNEQKHVLVKITNAATQIVSGINTRLTFELGLSNCTKSSMPEEVCSIMDNSKIKVCSVTVYSQPWTKTRRIENTFCKDKIPEEQIDTNSDKEKLVKHALGEVNKRSNSLYGQKLVQIHNYRRKMDNNNIAYLSLELGFTNCRKHNNMNFDSCDINSDSNNQLCYFKLYSPPDSDKIEINKMACNPVNNQRDKRNIPGGEEPTDINDSYIQKMVKFSLGELDKQSNDAYQKHLVRIIEAKKQVVQGNLIKLKFEIGLSNCLKREKNRENCQLQDNHGTEICSVKVWDRPWLEKTEITELKCSSNQMRKKRQTLGGISQANTSDPFVQEMVQHSLRELDRISNDEYHKHLVEIIEASKQVVAGSLTRLKIKISSSDCLKSSRKEEKTNCKLQKDKPIELCTMKVWDRPWLNSTEVQDVKCNIVTQRKKREDPEAYIKPALVGGLNTAKISDPYIKNLSKFSLDKLDESSNEIYHKHLIRIIEANKQLVAGNLVKLKLEVGLSDCLKNALQENKQNCKLQENEKQEICVVDIWDRPWLKETEVRNMQCTEKSQRLKRDNVNKKSHHEYKFRNFLIKHNKSYKTKEEFKRRFRIFRANLKKIEYLQETEQGTAIYGPTRFADLTTSEFKSKYLGLNPSLKDKNTKPLQDAEIFDSVIPKEFDWRHFNVVTPVKNQGACGSCWAFSVTGNIEGAWAIKKGQLLSLSEQELVDCDKLDNGCEGGLPTNAYTAIEQLGGLETESDYPYDGQDEKCSIERSELKVQISGAVNISSNETKMAQWLVANGPISIGINANAMQFYMGGVSHPLKFLCDPTNLDHGVLIVGYGVHKTKYLHRILPYWLIKNSWGTYWGEEGYYRVYRGEGTCGVNQMASSAIVN